MQGRAADQAGAAEAASAAVLGSGDSCTAAAAADAGGVTKAHRRQPPAAGVAPGHIVYQRACLVMPDCMDIRIWPTIVASAHQARGLSLPLQNCRQVSTPHISNVYP